MQKSEDNLVRWIASRCGMRGAGVRLGIGDDMAWVEFGGRQVLVTVDMLMDGVDFDTAVHSPRRIGRKAMAASLSDCAAMAVRPRYAVVSVALPEAWGMREAKALYAGLEEMARAHGCRIVGGDTNSWTRPLVVDVTMLAEPWAGVQPVRRDGMRPGDAIYVTGTLGGSLLGHHLDFQPRVREARKIAGCLGSRLHAMMDLSDGLSTDGHRMAAASGCGMELDAAALDLVTSRAAHRSAEADGRDMRDHVLNDGEDFELLCAVDARWAERIALPCGWTCIGKAVERQGLWLRGSSGQPAPIKSGGWEHWTARAKRKVKKLKSQKVKTTEEGGGVRR